MRLPGPSGSGNFEPAVAAEGKIVLADLIVLGQIGIVIILAIPLGEAGDAAIQGHGRLEGQVERPPIHDRQRSRHADANRTRRRVGGQAELGAAAAKQLRLRQELDVNFQADDRAIG